MIRLLCVGRMKEKFYAEGAEFYRPKAVIVTEVEDESAPESLSDADKRKIMEKEGLALLYYIDAKTIVVALDGAGKSYTAEELRGILRRHAGKDAAFVVGGSLGLGENIRKRADYVWSLSAMTFPHQLARVAVLAALGEVLGG